MNILVIGSGAREHALVWKLKSSPLAGHIYCAPGNAGIAPIADCVPLAANDIEGLIQFALRASIGLTIVGPEDPLAAGIVDAFQAAGLRAFGPTQAAARIESSKTFAKALAERAGIPSARHRAFSDKAAALAHLNGMEPPFVVKADGLAAGKGVIIAATRGEAEDAIGAILGGAFGAAGQSLVIEDFLSGEEVSVFALCDGTRAIPLGGAQDHKRAFDGDTGPNTGGMGAYAPPPILSQAHAETILDRMALPALRALHAAGTPFRGFLFTGAMIGPQGPMLVEFNARFGDPECQTLLALLDNDLLEGVRAAMTGRLDQWSPRWKPGAALTVVMAAKGYPGPYAKGSPIAGLDRAAAVPGVTVFHAGTALDADRRLTAQGGRTLSVTAQADSLAAAQALAYRAVDLIDWPGGFCRRDIGWRALAAAPKS
jgi:phosphoribosylamine--glycine ligase